MRTACLLLLASSLVLAQAPRSIHADANRVQGPTSQVWRQCIGAGRANEGLRADWQRQLAMVQREIGFRYIRFHALLTDDMGVYKEDAKGNAEYNWQYIDELYDALLRLHVKPFVEFAFMPRALASGTKTIFWWNGNVTPPKSYEKWGALVEALVRHWRERYGDDEVKTWYFEVWNEPDLDGFWSGGLDGYLKLYTTTAHAVKRVSKDYRVGGPASASPFDFEKALVKYCVENKVPIDFVSTHAYGVKQGFLDETGNAGTVLDADSSAVWSRMKGSRELIAASPLPKLELHFTEWSASYTPSDPIHDQYVEAPFILDKVKHTERIVDSLSYWTFTDIFEESAPRFTPFHGGFGLINYQDLRKPAYWAFQFLNRLGAQELASNDAASYVTKNVNGDLAVLAWDFTPIAPPDKMNNQVFYKREVVAKDKGTLKVQIDNVAAGHYALRATRVGHRSNDVYTAYLDMGAPLQLTRAQVEALAAIAAATPAEQIVVQHKGGAFVKELPLKENDVWMVELKKLD